MGQPITETIGVDLGDKYSAWCVVDRASGEEVGTGQILRDFTVDEKARYADLLDARSGGEAPPR